LTNSGGTETDSIHTSCSQPLITGDVYFSLTLVAEDGIGIAKDVLYKYKVTNTGATAINGISVTDNKLGTIQPSPFNLAAGANTTLSATAAITATTTNIATVADVGGSCVAGVVTSSATVTVTP